MTQELVNYFSEYAFFKYRHRVEILYFIFLIKLDFNELGKLKEGDNIKNLNQLINNFNVNRCLEIKKIEKRITHDVKSIEYHLIKQFDMINLGDYSHFIHYLVLNRIITCYTSTLFIVASCLTRIIVFTLP